MNQHLIIAEVFERQARRREERRKFLKAAGIASAAVAVSPLLSACGDGGGAGTPDTTSAPQISDGDILNFALNLEYLEANFYSFAVNGVGIGASLQAGKGTQGAATGGHAVPFKDPVVAAYAREIAGDELAHVAFLRKALGGAAVAQPAIDVGTGANGAFSSAARAAGLVKAGEVFDPYASDENFLLGAFIFEDVGVTAYKGASSALGNMYIEAAAGILAAEAYHAGLVRTVLYAKGIQAPSLISAANAISNARDSLDGSSDDDQGLTNADGSANLVPTDSDGIVYSRTTGQVLDIVFLTNLAAQKGGFFPNGVNGTINMSTAG